MRCRGADDRCRSRMRRDGANFTPSLHLSLRHALSDCVAPAELEVIFAVAAGLSNIASLF